MAVTCCDSWKAQNNPVEHTRLESAETEAKGITEEQLSELLSKLQGQAPGTAGHTWTILDYDPHLKHFQPIIRN